MFVLDGTSTWRQEGLIEDAALISGQALAVSGNGHRIASTARLPVPPSTVPRINAVLVYTLNAGGLCTRSANLLGKSPGPYLCSDPGLDSFGAALSFDHAGNTLAVGAPADHGDASDTGDDPGNRRALRAGAVHVFGATGSTRQRRAFLKARNATSNDEVGTEVALSGDGRVLLGKACGYSGNAAGVRRNHRAGTEIGRQEGDTSTSCFWGGSGYAWTQGEAGRWSHTASVIPVGSDLVAYGFFSLALRADATTFALGTSTYYPQRETESRVFVY